MKAAAWVIAGDLALMLVLAAAALFFWIGL